MKRSFLFALIACFAIAPVVADRPIDKTVAADLEGEVSIELIAGSIQVKAWDQAEVRVTGTVGDDVEEVEVESRGDRVSIEVELTDDDDDSSRGRSFNDAGADLEIWVPAGSHVEVESVSADVSVEGVRGTASVECVSGDIEVDGALREVEAASVSGDIMVVSDEPLAEGNFETVSGDIEVRAALGNGDYSFESVSGDIDLLLPANTSADFDVETFSGRIQNDFGPEGDDESEDSHGKSLEFTVGGGAADVEVESFSGKIRLRAN